MGKSTTARIFAEEGVPVWDADASVAELYGKNSNAVPMIAFMVPDAVVDGQVDRSTLRDAISKDPGLLPKIEAVVHPLVAEDREVFLKDHEAADLVLLDIPLYFETGAKLDASVLVVTTSEDIQRERVLSRGTMTEDEFEVIKARQMPDAEKRERANFIIETRSLEQTRNDVQNLISKLRAE